MGAADYIEKIKKIETPFYFYDMNLLRKTLENVLECSSQYGYKVHYAMKANNEDRILKEILSYGFGVDCVSGNEVHKAVEMGCDPSKIAFAGVGKTYKEIKYALSAGIFSFNCESRHELEVINSLAADMKLTANVALRINPDIDPQTHKYIATGKSNGKFGISYSEIEEVLNEINLYKNINIVGIHFHIGSQITSLEPFRKLCERANMLVEWFESKGLNLEHINLGGGLGISYENPEAEPIPDFKSYFELFHNGLKVRSGQTVHFELGRSIVGQCGELITKVLYNKTNPDKDNILIVDAGMTDLIRPALYGASHKIVNITSESTEKNKYMVAGPICESTDVFSKSVVLPTSQRGDLLSIKSAGAYGSAMASRYNLRDLPESIYSDSF